MTGLRTSINQQGEFPEKPKIVLNSIMVRINVFILFNLFTCYRINLIRQRCGRQERGKMDKWRLALHIFPYQASGMIIGARICYHEKSLSTTLRCITVSDKLWGRSVC